MNIDVAKYSFHGGHQINEDSVYVGDNVFVVCDGLGGHSNGEVASAVAVEYIKNNYCGDISDNGIASIIKGANKAVCELNNGSHTTVAAAFLNGEQLRMANVGDSRVYIFRNDKLYMITKDHSVCQAAVDMGEMTFEDIRFSEDRSRLLKVLGSEANLSVNNNYNVIDLCDGDAFLICSDGFWEYVHEREMEVDLLKSENADMWARRMLKRHILKAHDEGDNYSVICGIVHNGRKPTPVISSNNISTVPMTSELSQDSVPKIDELIESVNKSNSNAACSGENNNKNKMLPFILGAIMVIVVAVILIVMIISGEKKEVESNGFSDDSVYIPVSEEYSSPGSETVEGESVEFSSEVTSDAVLPSGESTSPSGESTSPSGESTLPTEESALPTEESELSTKEAASVTDDAVPPSYFVDGE